MALIKEMEIKDLGITANYWKVAMVSIDTLRQEASFGLVLLTKKGATKYIYDIGVSDLMIAEDKTLFEKYFGEGTSIYRDVYNACYEYAKEHVDLFKDAVDDPEEMMLKSKK